MTEAQKAVISTSRKLYGMALDRGLIDEPEARTYFDALMAHDQDDRSTYLPPHPAPATRAELAAAWAEFAPRLTEMKAQHANYEDADPAPEFEDAWYTVAVAIDLLTRGVEAVSPEPCTDFDCGKPETHVYGPNCQLLDRNRRGR